MLACSHRRRRCPEGRVLDTRPGPTGARLGSSVSPAAPAWARWAPFWLPAPGARTFTAAAVARAICIIELSHKPDSRGPPRATNNLRRPTGWLAGRPAGRTNGNWALNQTKSDG